MDLQLNGQIVVITGSSKGIGKGIAEAFLQEGATVVLTGRNKSILKTTQKYFMKTYGIERVHSFAGDLQKDCVKLE